MKDIVGNDITENCAVVVAHNGRIILGRVTKLNQRSDSVTVTPIHSDSGGRRTAPDMKPFRRSDYNVFVINDGEMLVAALKSFTTIVDHDMELDRKLWRGELDEQDQ
jgi:hypothetical protein